MPIAKIRARPISAQEQWILEIVITKPSQLCRQYSNPDCRTVYWCNKRFIPPRVPVIFDVNNIKECRQEIFSNTSKNKVVKI